MRVDFSPRQAGKTMRMIQWLKGDPDRMLITFNEREADRLRRDFPKLAERIVSWRWMLQHAHGNNAEFRTVGIDNADMILRNLVPWPIDIISISDEEDETK